MGFVRVFLVLAAAFGFCLAANETLPEREGFTNLGPVPATSDTVASSLGRFYWLSNTEATWINAYSACVSQGGRLVSLSNPQLDDTLRNHLIVNNYGGVIWIGAKQSGSSWFWVATNTPMMYNKWQSPSCAASSNLCAYAGGATGNSYHWCVTYCTNSYKFVCEA